MLEAAGKALERYGSGSTGSRLLNGTLDLHDELEERLADFLGKEAALLLAWGTLFDHEVMAHPVVPPAVPVGTCRLRISLTAEHTDDEVDRALQAFRSVLPLRSHATSDAAESA